MEVKGTAVVTTSSFALKRFGQAAHDAWLARLPPSSRDLLSGRILPVAWYPVNEALIVPTRVLCDEFFAGDKKGAWEIGRFSADYALRGFYKIVVKAGSLNWIADRAASIFTSYYRPSAAETFESRRGYACFRVTQFEDVSGIVEQRVGGWLDRAVEISGGFKEKSVRITKSIAAGDPFLEYQVNWQ